MNKLSVLWKFVSMKKTFRSITSIFLVLRICFNQQNNVARLAAMRQQSKAYTNQRGNTSTHQKGNK